MIIAEKNPLRCQTQISGGLVLGAWCLVLGAWCGCLPVIIHKSRLNVPAVVRFVYSGSISAWILLRPIHTVFIQISAAFALRKYSCNPTRPRFDICWKWGLGPVQTPLFSGASEPLLGHETQPAIPPVHEHFGSRHDLQHTQLDIHAPCGVLWTRPESGNTFFLNLAGILTVLGEASKR